MTCIAVRGPPCQSAQLVTRGTRPHGTQRDSCLHTVCAREVFRWTTTKDVCRRCSHISWTCVSMRVGYAIPSRCCTSVSTRCSVHAHSVSALAQSRWMREGGVSGRSKPSGSCGVRSSTPQEQSWPMCGRRKDEGFLQRTALLEPSGLTRCAPDPRGAYARHLDPEGRCPGKPHPSHIAREQRTLRARITPLVRTRICVARSTSMHENVIGLCVHRDACARAVDTWPSPRCAHSSPRGKGPDEGVTTCRTDCTAETVTR